MRIDPAFVGREVHGPARVVTWRETTSYAAATGDANPRYLDDSVAGGLVAPPMFAVALTWPMLAGIGRAIEGFPIEVMKTMVHSGEHLRFFRLVRPGDRIELHGRIVALRPGRAGTRLVLRVSAEAGGEPVFTEYATALLRGVECPDGGASIEDLPEPMVVNETNVPSWESMIPLAREAPFVYDACTGIVFPIHTSVSYARQAGLPDLLIQGTCTLAMAAREIIDREAGGDPSALREIGCSFRGMVIPPTTIGVRLTARAPGDGETNLAFKVVDAAGNPALDMGRAIVGAAR